MGSEIYHKDIAISIIFVYTVNNRGGMYMMKTNDNIKSGDLFAFAENNKFGLIQAIKKSTAGFWVRVFYFLQDNLSEDNILKIVSGSDFYYLDNFFELTKAEKYLGNYQLPQFVELPQFMRSCERKTSGNLIWYITNVSNGKVAKILKKFDTELAPLSPSENWGIDYIKKMWQANFTLNSWNSEFMDTLYLSYLKEFEPERFNSRRDLNFSSIKETMPTKKWKESLSIDSPSTNLTKDAVQIIEKQLINFFTTVQSNISGTDAIEVATKQVILDLNAINKKYSCIETEESEEILEFLSNVLKVISEGHILDSFEDLRTW